MKKRALAVFSVFFAFAAMSGLGALVASADDTPPPPEGSVKEHLVRDLVGDSSKEIRLLTVTYPPGGKSPPHRHNAQVFVYVLEGVVNMQVEGSPPVTLHTGETFYEGPKDIHVVSANASQTLPARILVFMVKDKHQPISSAPKSASHG